MTQQDVMQFLSDHKGEWFNTTEIAYFTNQSVGSTICNMKRLRDWGFVKWKIIESRKYIYAYK